MDPSGPRPGNQTRRGDEMLEASHEVEHPGLVRTVTIEGCDASHRLRARDSASLADMMFAANLDRLRFMLSPGTNDSARPSR